MSRYKISLQRARSLQRWALKESRAEELLKNVPKLPNTKKIKQRLYVCYSIDKSELDDCIDWPAPAIATIYAVLNSNKIIYIGEIRAYNFETYWLSTREDEQVDTAENWWDLINEEYRRLLKLDKVIK
ncbi:MAG: hypothetical protein AABX12_01840 [Nanoarchaeota archaeon]